jgi:hypothetical protein
MRRSLECIDRARSLSRESRPTPALAALLEIPDGFAWTARELVLRDRLILLAEESAAARVSLSDAEAAFQQALELEEQNTEALLELARSGG